MPFREWLDGRLRPEGYACRVIGTFGVIQVIEFSRPSSARRITMPDAADPGGDPMKSDVKGRPQPIEEPPAPGHVRWLLMVTAVVIGALWLVPLFSSLWLDELGTYWVVKDGLGDAVHRALTFHGQSPLYYSIVWAARSVGGNSEAVLRLPSLIATAASLVSSTGSLGP